MAADIVLTLVSHRPRCRVFAVEPAGDDGTKWSLETGDRSATR